MMSEVSSFGNGKTGCEQLYNLRPAIVKASKHIVWAGSLMGQMFAAHAGKSGLQDYWASFRTALLK